MNRSEKHFELISLCLCLLVGWVCVAGCRPSPEDIVGHAPLPEVHRNPENPERYYTQFDTMGTYARFEVVSTDEDRATQMLHSAYKETQMVHVLMSTYRDDSDISRLNRNGAQKAVEVADMTYDALELAKKMSEQTGGAFEPTYAPLRTLWRGAQSEDKLPSQEDLEETRKLVGSDGLILEDGKARLARKGMEVDLGGIAKGYGIDQATEKFIELGAEGAMVNIGGDMRVVGKRGDGRPWKIGVQCPDGAEEYCPIYLALQDVAVATSGDYARGYSIEGERYSHILDPRTGRPVSNAPSVTVIASSAARADALATAISVMGPEKALSMVEGTDGVECLLLVRTGKDKVKKYASSGFSNYRWQEKNGGTETGDSSGRAQSGDS